MLSFGNPFFMHYDKNFNLYGRKLKKYLDSVLRKYLKQGLRAAQDIALFMHVAERVRSISESCMPDLSRCKALPS